MNTKRNMGIKLFITIFLFFITACNTKSSLFEEFDNYILFSDKSNFQNGNVFSIGGGFRLNEHTLNYENGLMKVDIDMFYIKPSIYLSKPISKSKTKIALSLLRFNSFGTIHDDRRLVSMNLNLIDYNPTNFYENYTDWFLINLKGGYNLLSKNNRIIAPMISGSLGFSTIKTGSKYFSKLASFSKETFTGLNIDFGMFLIVNYEFIHIKLSSECDLLFGEKTLNTWENDVWLKIIDKNEIEKTDLDYSYLQFIENYCINLMFESKNLYIGKQKQTMNIFGIELIKYIH